MLGQAVMHPKLNKKKNKKMNNLKSFFLVPTKPEEVMKVIGELKSKKSRDIYGFMVSPLKEVAHSLAEPISSLINGCFEEGYFPDELRLAKHIPVHKKRAN